MVFKASAVKLQFSSIHSASLQPESTEVNNFHLTWCVHFNTIFTVIFFSLKYQFCNHVAAQLHVEDENWGWSGSGMAGGHRQLNSSLNWNKQSVKALLSTDSWFGYLSIFLIQESKLNALEKGAFDVEAEARTDGWGIWVCFPVGYTTKDEEYF